ncbi:MAG: glutamyl-tRNA reductase, partial [Clostridium sp.]|nr:glutamyl-tRNA reductase [Clostridium sp.]
DKEVLKLERIEGYNIDEISKIDDKNKVLRMERMNQYEYIINDSINEYIKWLELRKLSPEIKKIKENAERVYKRRLKTYINKSKDIDESELVEKLLKSITNLYSNRAIEILKEEKLKGSEKECLEIIKKIFTKEE